jgi:uncharacterized protein (UPF0333 family)
MMRGQGATEYLVLLAVVLIVALVSVALLGFFPGMANDAQLTQSQTYWQSASPAAIIEASGKARPDATYATIPYMRLRNTGAYPIRITQLLGAGGQNISQVYDASITNNISNLFYMAPGEEKYFGDYIYVGHNVPLEIYVYFAVPAGESGGYGLYAASSICQNSTTAPGMLVIKDFGFEYIEYVEGQQLLKREVGKQLMIRCTG